MLLQIPDLLTPDEVRHARQLLADAPWAHGRIHAGPQAAQVKNNRELPDDCPAARAIQSMVLTAVERTPLFFSAALPKKIFTPRVNCHGGDSPHYGYHADGAIRFRADTGEKIRTDLSCSLYLSEAEDYDGGELVVRDTYGTRKIKLPAGHAVLYPATSIHQVTPVTRGYRMACFFFIESMVRGDEQRALLYDMDMALTGLRQRQGESDETVTLVGTYHNLLRMWADT